MGLLGTISVTREAPEGTIALGYFDISGLEESFPWDTASDSLSAVSSVLRNSAVAVCERLDNIRIRGISGV